MLDSTVVNQTQEVLDSLNDALAQGDIERAAALFATDSYWRDLVAVSWNLKTVEGPAGVADLLSHQLAHTRPGNFTIQSGEVPAEEGGVVTAWITFETATGRGWGLMRLRDGKIWTLLTALQELKGFEEPRVAPAARWAPSMAHARIAARGRSGARRNRRSWASPRSPMC